MNVAPIPKNMLIHSIDYYQHTGRDKWSNDTFSDPVTVSFVRVEPSTSFERNTLDNKQVFNSVIFIDAVNSKHEGINFTERSKVLFKGREMVVKKAIELTQPFKDALHHWELEVV